MDPLPYRPTSTDAYIGSVTWIECYQPDHRIFVRTGITPPGYPDHPVYGQHAGGIEPTSQTKGPLYVLEANRFWESAAWRDYFRSHGYTPAQAADAYPPTPAKLAAAAQHLLREWIRFPQHEQGYLLMLKQLVAVFGGEFITMTKKPFGFHFQMDGKSYAVLSGQKNCTVKQVAPAQNAAR